jgi:hypothetical protein
MGQPHRVDDRPLRRVDPQQLASLRGLLAPVKVERGRGEDVNESGRMLDPRSMRPARHSDVDEGRQLVGQIPMGQRGVEADRAARDKRTDRSKIGAGADLAFSTTEDAWPDGDDLASVTQSVHLVARDTYRGCLYDTKRPIAELLQPSACLRDAHCYKTYITFSIL